ncbi:MULTISPECIES: hypothetical protein [Curtobacterium]|nr:MULTISPECIES: hypothetical protein [Curtobacterium]MBO9039368.1 hypothetical protein [Curtobacterium flaccumfaciens pv. flaccumfaciens]MCS6563099.1 hypothetical protein [Curtobacterium flaccumfaciens pv. poinsettiae]UXN30013.1 hypothetical protein N8D75_07030 [Curtobacterium flaccumfaciens]
MPHRRGATSQGENMSLRTTGITLGTTVAIIMSSVLVAPSAHAVDRSAPSSTAGPSTTQPLTDVTPEQLDVAVAEARAGGYVIDERIERDGARMTTIELGDGFSFDIVQGDPRARLGAGSDKYGTYVSFNATDQSAIISGAGWALGAGVCAISAGTFCVVAGAIIAAATWAVTTNGIRCGSKSLRVYPFNGARNPRCV